MDVPDTQLVVTTSDDVEVVAYRSLSLLAIAALLLGLFSALAFVHPLLWAAPLVASVVAVLAIVQTSRQRDQLSGRGLALAGLGLSIFFGVAAPSRWLTFEMVLYGQARGRAQEWLELVSAGQRLEAFELHLPPRQRHGARENLAETYNKSADAKKAESEFWDKDPQRMLLAAGDRAQTVFVKNVAIIPDDESDRSRIVILDYEFRIAGESGDSPHPLRLFLRRRIEADDPVARWELLNVVDPSTLPKGS